MTGLQKFLLALLPPGRRPAAEAESRQWRIICANCGHATSNWDMGGVRYAATGHSLTFARCRACGKRGTHGVMKDPAA